MDVVKHWAVGLGPDASVADAVDIVWPVAAVAPSIDGERSVARVIKRKPVFVNRRGRDLPADKAGAIAAAAAANGMTETQALSLRRHIIRKMVGHAPQSQGSANGLHQQQIATLFEDSCVAYVEERGAIWSSDAAEIRAKYATTLTPDVVFDTPTKINGVLVGWLDAKNFYGNALFASDRRSMTGKLGAQSERYMATFGPGAFVFRQGYACPPHRHHGACTTLFALVHDIKLQIE